ncbi:hypothetical protein [Mammaliicoccus lentus]|uniref:hypothetical protein n=1 Tax=Mammaliicoccus lentus TaxID=42858 RepID=UPI002B26205D|nr:hypothetical protein [Mammaliicoccus lentus]WQK50314.1 hypothetical protein P3U54_01025 [Mammaliicoccus lentus]
MNKRLVAIKIVEINKQVLKILITVLILFAGIFSDSIPEIIFRFFVIDMYIERMVETVINTIAIIKSVSINIHP